jgi:hypothetical protein
MIERKTPVIFGNARFTVYASGCVRLEYADRGRFIPWPSLLTGRIAAKPQAARVHRTARVLTLQTDRLTLRYEPDGQNFSPANLRITHASATGGIATWTPGQRDGGNLGTVTRALDVWNHCGGPERFPVEGLLSTEGGHLVPDEPRVYWNPKHRWPQTMSHQVWFDGYFFAYGRDYKSALQDYVNVFGRIPIIPRWAFGFWYSRWHAYTGREFVELARRYRRAGVPIDVMVIDTDWRDHWGGYDWSKKYFPRPRQALAALRRMGLRVTLNDHPGYDNYDALPADDSHIPAIQKRLGPIPHQGQWACDWSNRKAVKTWRDVLLGPPFDLGMDFWWVDGWIKPPFGGVDSQFWANHHYFDLAEEKTGRRGLILSRWGGIGSHRYPVQFSGDTFSTWETLRHQIEFTARSGNLGAAYWSHDIGGFHDRRVDDELYCRWVQFGSLSPVFRTHSAHGLREPWHYSARFRRVLKKQTRMRYALAPYFYTLAREAHDHGLPLVRPLYLEYNRDNDRNARERRHQYTLGADLLVIPGDAPADKLSGCQRKRAYFPGHAWYALETDEVIQGIDDRPILIPIDRIPVYVRAGAIIPCQRVGEALGARPPAELQFDVYPSLDAASRYTLYEDDGESRDYRRGRCARTTVRVERRGRRITLEIGAPRGRYAGMPQRRTFIVRVRLEPGDRVDRAWTRVRSRRPKKIPCRITRRCLAGEVRSGHRFAEIRLVSANEAARAEILLA